MDTRQVQIDSGATAPSLFTAIRKLGITLQPQKLLFDFLVVDHAERPEMNQCV
jgi:uncharacterized protein (TIGR03435 family)